MAIFTGLVQLSEWKKTCGNRDEKIVWAVTYH